MQQENSAKPNRQNTCESRKLNPWARRKANWQNEPKVERLKYAYHAWVMGTRGFTNMRLTPKHNVNWIPKYNTVYCIFLVTHMKKWIFIVMYRSIFNHKAILGATYFLLFLVLLLLVFFPVWLPSIFFPSSSPPKPFDNSSKVIGFLDFCFVSLFWKW